jgi:hypothetical protein
VQSDASLSVGGSASIFVVASAQRRWELELAYGCGLVPNASRRRAGGRTGNQNGHRTTAGPSANSGRWSRSPIPGLAKIDIEKLAAAGSSKSNGQRPSNFVKLVESLVAGTSIERDFRRCRATQCGLALAVK